MSADLARALQSDLRNWFRWQEGSDRQPGHECPDMGPHNWVSQGPRVGTSRPFTNPMCCSECLAVLAGHTSLVGQLQMRGDTLVTGGSDGSVRIWTMEGKRAIHRLAAHDNSVTSLQFDETRVVSGGSDGRVKIWDLKTGQLVRELIAQGEAVWRVAFEDEKCVALALRSSRTVMEVSTWRAIFRHHMLTGP